MRIIRFDAGKGARYGTLEDNKIQSLENNPFINYTSKPELKYDGETYNADSVKLLAPCEPSKLVCLGLNYRPHADELNFKLPIDPLIFLKPSTSVIGPDENIVMPKKWRRVDYEGELGVVISKKARFVSEEEAEKYIFGYTCVNDVTERTLQKFDGQWTRAKGFDTFAPVGPWIETELDPSDLKLETILNGKVRQTASTGELIFNISQLISFISGVMTLLPGDIISTGTPAGIDGMQPGDTVEIKIEKLGTLRNKVVEA